MDPRVSAEQSADASSSGEEDKNGSTALTTCIIGRTDIHILGKLGRSADQS